MLGVLAAACLVGFAVFNFARDPESLKTRAEAAERAGDRAAALQAWQDYHATGKGGGRSRLAEAKAFLAMNRAEKAERSLAESLRSDPADPEPWRLYLEILRVESRVVETEKIGRDAAEALAPGRRLGALREWTTAFLLFEADLDDLSEDKARAALERWIEGDPKDLNARVALHRRMAARPRDGDPDRDARIAELESIVASRPDHINAREALVAALADAGDSAKGRAHLNDWPAASRDARFDRLSGRFSLDHENKPAEAAASLERVLLTLPHDWKTRYRLARAYRALDRLDDAKRQADVVTRLRELLDPARLAPRLAEDLARADDPKALLNLSELCRKAGLDRLGEAWRVEAAAIARSH